jgi:hypothetical protein
MINLSQTNETEIQRYARELFKTYQQQDLTFETLSQKLMHNVYDDFCNEQGQRIFILTRIFRLCKYLELPPEAHSEIDSSSGKFWLALCGTVGDEPAWNNRHQSQGHRIIPGGAFQTPMLKAVFEQMALEKTLQEGESGIKLEDYNIAERFFHVETAPGSPYIVAQEDFVNRYGVHSVIGIGSPFISGSFYFALFFARATITRPQAELFARITPFISTLLARQDAKNHLWESLEN